MQISSITNNTKQNPYFNSGILVSSKDFYNARKIAKTPALKQKITSIEKFLKSEKPQLITYMNDLIKRADIIPEEIPSIKFGFKLDRKGLNLTTKLDDKNKPFTESLELSGCFDNNGKLKQDDSFLIRILDRKVQEGIDIFKRKHFKPQQSAPVQPKPETIKIPILYKESPFFSALSKLEPFITIDKESYKRILEKVFKETTQK